MQKTTIQIGQNKFLFLEKSKILYPGLRFSDLIDKKKMIGTFFEKELQKKERKTNSGLRIEKVIKKKVRTCM